MGGGGGGQCPPTFKSGGAVAPPAPPSPTPLLCKFCIKGGASFQLQDSGVELCSHLKTCTDLLEAEKMAHIWATFVLISMLVAMASASAIGSADLQRSLLQLGQGAAEGIPAAVDTNTCINVLCYVLCL